MVAVPGVRDSRVEWQPACVGLRRETMGRGVASVSAPGLPIDCSLAERLLSKSGLFAAEMMGNLVHRRLCCLPVTYEKAGARTSGRISRSGYSLSRIFANWKTSWRVCICTSDIYENVLEWRSPKSRCDRSGVRMLVGNALVGNKWADGRRLSSTIATHLARNGLACVLPAGIILLRGSSGCVCVPTRKQWESLADPPRLEAPSQRVPLTGGVSKGGQARNGLQKPTRWGKPV